MAWNEIAFSQDCTGLALTRAAGRVGLAASACFNWEQGGTPDAVTETAAVARHLAAIAFEAVISDEPWDDLHSEPGTRRGRLAYAAWLLFLAGTDEGGGSGDLSLAAQLFECAASA